MLLSYDDFREQISDVLFYTWDPEDRQLDKTGNRHHYYHLSDEVAQVVIDDQRIETVRSLLESIRMRCWPQSQPKPSQETAAQAIKQLIDQTTVEIN